MQASNQSGKWETTFAAFCKPAQYWINKVFVQNKNPVFEQLYVYEFKRDEIKCMVIEPRVVQFWSETIHAISNKTRAARSFNFEITRTADQIALHSVQLQLFISINNFSNHKSGNLDIVGRAGLLCDVLDVFCTECALARGPKVLDMFGFAFLSVLIGFSVLPFIYVITKLIPLLEAFGDCFRSKEEVSSQNNLDENAFLRGYGYELDRVIGQGSYADVRKAYSIKSEREVAIKIVHKEEVKIAAVLKIRVNSISITLVLIHPNRCMKDSLTRLKNFSKTF